MLNIWILTFEINVLKIFNFGVNRTRVKKKRKKKKNTIKKNKQNLIIYATWKIYHSQVLIVSTKAQTFKLTEDLQPCPHKLY